MNINTLKTVLLVLFSTLFLLTACNGEDGNASDDQVDGDADTVAGIPCYNDIDCPPPMVCSEGYCVDDGDSDGGMTCESQLDCPPEMYCDLDDGICKALENDGDEDLDMVESEPELDEVEEEIEIEAEVEEEPEPPEFEIVFEHPSDGQGVMGEVVLQAKVITELAVDRVEFLFDGNIIGQPVSAEPYVTTWDMSAFSDGDYTVSAKAYSGEFVAETSLTVALDNTAPEVSITTPEDDEVFGYDDEVILSLTAFDHLEKIKVFIDDVEETEINSFDQTGVVSLTMLAKDYSAGQHKISVEVYDQPGHEAVTDEVLILMEDSAPEIVIEGLNFEDEDNAWVMANDEFSVDVSDDSGISYISVTLSHGVLGNIYSLNDASELPAVIGDFDSKLSEDYQLYPMEAMLTISAADNFGTNVVRNIALTTRRVLWSFNPEVEVGYTYETLMGAAVSSQGHVYAAVYDTLFSVTGSEGVERWRDDLGVEIVTTPVVREFTGYPAVVVVADKNGNLHFCKDDSSSVDCQSFLPGAGLAMPAAPVLEDPVVRDGVFSFDSYFCARRNDEIACYKINYEWSDARGATISNVWDLPAVLPANSTSTAPLVPSGVSDSFYVGAGNRVFKIKKADGRVPDYSSVFSEGQEITQIMPNPAGSGIYAVSEKEFRLFGYNFADFGIYILNPETTDSFESVQSLSDSDGNFFISMKKYDEGIDKGVLEAWQIDSFGFGESLWTFKDTSRIGATPAFGPGRKMYLPGRSSLGKLWSVDIDAEHPRSCSEIPNNGNACMGISEVGCCNNSILMWCDNGNLMTEDCSQNSTATKQCGWQEDQEKYICRSAPTFQKGGALAWRMQLGSGIKAPLTVDSSGNLIVVGNDGTLTCVQLSQGAAVDETGWQMWQGDQSNSGLFSSAL